MQQRHKALIMMGGLAITLTVAGCNNSQPSTPPTTTTVNTTPPAATTTTTANGSATTTTTTPGTNAPKINNNAGPGSASGTDSATADAVNAAIVRNKEMTGSRVDVVVTNGVARLTGTVQDQQQKALAATTAKNVSGVTSVDNKLIIDATGGAHSAASKPKVVNHTTIINHYIPVPTGTAGSGSDTSGSGMGGTMSGGSGSSAAASGGSSSSSATSGGGASTDNSGGNGNGGNGNGGNGGG